MPGSGRGSEHGLPDLDADPGRTRRIWTRTGAAVLVVGLPAYDRGHFPLHDEQGKRMRETRDLQTALDEQKQLITSGQLRSLQAAGEPGVRRARRDRLERLAPGLYGTKGVPHTWERRVLGAVLRSGGRAVASHRSAARLLGIETFEAAPAEVSIPSKRNFAHPGVLVHQSRDLEWVPPIVLHGIPCTPPRRLAVDLGAVLGEAAYASALRTLRRDHGISWKQLAAILELHSRHGRDGCGPLRRQVERYHGIDGIPGSALEQHLLDVMIDVGIALPTCQHQVPTPWGVPYVLDFAYVDALLAIEVDGPYHGLPDVAARDRRRDAFLRSLGWEVLRFDERAVLYGTSTVLLEIRRALEARGAVHLLHLAV